LDAIKTIVSLTPKTTIVEKVMIDEIVFDLKILQDLCSSNHEMSKRNLILIRTNGGLNALHNLLFSNQNHEILIEALNLLEIVSINNVENRDFLEPGGSKKISEIIAYHMDNIDTNIEAYIAVIIAGLSMARCAARSENNKGMLMRYSMGEIIVKLLKTDKVEDAWNDVKKVACQVLRGLSVHDDYRKEMSCGHDNGRFFLGSIGTVPALMKLSQNFRNNPLLATAAISAARNLITTEESVLVMCQHGGMKLSSDILGYPNASTSLVKAVVGFMRNLCADDMRKEALVCDGSMGLLVAAMSDKRFFEDSGLLEHGAACLAAMSLRYRVIISGMLYAFYSCLTGSICLFYVGHIEKYLEPSASL
jgi:hypothetical protein